MLVKRIEKNDIIKAMYASSTICASTYDKKTKDLTVIFNNGGRYKYPNVSLTDYTRVETAESNGSSFNTYIKKNYTNFEKLDPLDDAKTKAILAEIKELTPEEEKVNVAVVEIEMLESMGNLLTDYIKSGSINKDILKKVTENITIYNKINHLESYEH
jgi:hypothetical protein